MKADASIKRYVWIALYNSCIHESDALPLSVHCTKKGALEAMAKHKSLKRQFYDDAFGVDTSKLDSVFGDPLDDMWWGVKRFRLKS